MNNIVLPLPDGITPPTWWEKLFPEWMIMGAQNFALFVQENILWFLLLGIIILLIKFWYDAERKKFFQIKKLWTFTLFFLSKRLMMIPLIITFSRRSGELSNKKVEQLLELRNECRSVSLRKNPQERLQREKKISEELFRFFQERETKGELSQNAHLTRIAHDLEFIDKKLVELQLAYNHEARRWNRNRNVAKKLLGLPSLTLFEE
jgi:hypothetical protein